MTNWIEIIGYAASASVLLTFCMGTMLPLRAVAISSNVLFATYGLLAHIYPVLVLHVILFPVNVARLLQILSLMKGIKSAHSSELSVEALLPFMSRRFFRAGETLLKKGDRADHMYYLAAGSMKIVEFGKTIEAGGLFGEIGIFAREQKRTATIVCISDCEVYEISGSKAKQLYFQNPSFGFAIFQLVIDRLLAQVDILQAGSEGPGRSALP
jgi:hypothetical protein